MRLLIQEINECLKCPQRHQYHGRSKCIMLSPEENRGWEKWWNSGKHRWPDGVYEECPLPRIEPEGEA